MEDKLYLDHDISVYSIDNIRHSISSLLNISIEELISNDIIDNYIEKYNELFISINRIDNDKIIYSEDKIILLNTIPKYLEIDNYIRYRKIDRFSNLIVLNSIGFLLESDLLGQKQSIVGLSDININNHKDYMISFIFRVLNILISGDIKTSIDIIKKFYNDYINRLLPLEYYRVLNDESCFIIVYNNSSFNIYGNNIDQSYIEYIDISYNRRIIQRLYSLVCELLFKTA